jgi:hypothetical protein
LSESKEENPLREVVEEITDSLSYVKAPVFTYGTVPENLKFHLAHGPASKTSLKMPFPGTFKAAILILA